MVKKAKFNCHFTLEYNGAYEIEAQDYDVAQEMVEKQVGYVAPTLKMFGNEIKPKVTTWAAFIVEDFNEPRKLRANYDSSWSLLGKDDKELCCFNIGDSLKVRDAEYPTEYLASPVIGILIQKDGDFIVYGEEGQSILIDKIIAMEVMD